MTPAPLRFRAPFPRRHFRFSIFDSRVSIFTLRGIPDACPHGARSSRASMLRRGRGVGVGARATRQEGSWGGITPRPTSPIHVSSSVLACLCSRVGRGERRDGRFAALDIHSSPDPLSTSTPSGKSTRAHDPETASAPRASAARAVGPKAHLVASWFEKRIHDHTHVGRLSERADATLCEHDSRARLRSIRAGMQQPSPISHRPSPLAPRPSCRPRCCCAPARVFWRRAVTPVRRECLFSV